MRAVAFVFLTATAGWLGAGCAGPGAASDSSGADSLSRAQIEAIVASPDRSEADRRNDVRRKPVDMLASPACGRA